MSKTTAVLSVVGLLVMTATAAALPTAEELFKQMVERSATLKTYEADTAMWAQSPQGPMTSTGHIVTQVIEKDGKRIEKMCRTTETSMDTGEGKQKMQIKEVDDGEFLWREMRGSEMPTQVMKMKSGQTMPGQTGPPSDPQTAMDDFKKDHNLKVTGEETIDAEKMYVVEGTLKAGARTGPEVPAKIRMCLNQKTLVMRRTTGYARDGKETYRTDATNVKIGQPVNAELFKYSPPPGAMVIDMTTGFPMPTGIPGM